jgi:hypothetical protein
MTTLTDGTTTATFTDDVLWVDEFDWHPVSAKSGRTVTGALWVEEAALSAGRPITLQSPGDGGPVARSQMLNLQTLAAIAGASLTLTLRGVTYTVMFDRDGGKPLEAKPFIDYSDVDAADLYLITLRLRTIA